VGDGGSVNAGGAFWEKDTVIITARTPDEGRKFLKWTTQSAGVTFGNAGYATTTFIMPGNTVKVTAVFVTPHVDSIDYGGVRYGWVTIGNRKWMSKNLR